MTSQDSAKATNRERCERCRQKKGRAYAAIGLQRASTGRVSHGYARIEELEALEKELRCRKNAYDSD